MKLSDTSNKSPNKSAFSLVEVTMAIGIISVVLVTLMGLMPIGLSTMQQAVNQVEETQIAKRIQADLLVAPFKDTLSSYPSLQYFDQVGVRLDNETGKHYTVEVSFDAPQFPVDATANRRELDDKWQDRLQVARIKIKRENSTKSFVSEFNVLIPISARSSKVPQA